MLAVTLGNNCLWRESLARTACVSVGVCRRDREMENEWEECVSIFSLGCLEMCMSVLVGCGSII